MSTFPDITRPAGPNMRAHLEQLPVEVQMSILCHLGTLDAALTLLRASPRFLYVYRTNRNVIYPEIVYRHIAPSALPAAIVALNLRDQGMVADILTFTEASSIVVDRSKLSLIDWRYLYQTYCAVEEMIHDSVNRAYRIIQQYPPSLRYGAFDMPLSPTEYTRLLRGFYNWEIMTAIGSRYFSGTSLAGELEAPLEPSDLERYLEHFRLFCKALVPHEFEEMYFVAYYLRTQLYEFLDKAEDDQFGLWKSSGPYKYRYDFDEHESTIWTNRGRGSQDMWVGNTLYSTSLTAIFHIVHEAKPSERMRRVEAINTDNESPYRTRWRTLEGKLEHQRTLTVANLASPLLPQGWHSGRLPKLNWDCLEFEDSIEYCNLGLLWGCRSPRLDRPQFGLLQRMSIWGAALWDAERLRRMRVLGDDPANIARVEDNALMRHRRYDADHPRRNISSIEQRVHGLEDEWIDQGRMPDAWDFEYHCNRTRKPIYNRVGRDGDGHGDDDDFDRDYDSEDDSSSCDDPHYCRYDRGRDDNADHDYDPEDHSDQSESNQAL